MNIVRLLEVYSLPEIIEFNDLTEEDALMFLVEQGFLKKLPQPQPLDFEDA